MVYDYIYVAIENEALQEEIRLEFDNRKIATDKVIFFGTNWVPAFGWVIIEIYKRYSREKYCTNPFGKFKYI